MNPEASRLGLSQVTAAILVGGLGTRLRAVVSDCPKILAEVRGKPFLSYLLDQLNRHGVQKAVLCAGYQGDRVKAACGDAYGSLRLFYSQESEPLGTAGALRLALPQLDSDPVLVMNGDSYCDADLDDFFAWHAGCGAEASLILTEVEDTGRYGRVSVAEDGSVMRFEEKKAGAGPGWINAGVYLLGCPILASVPEGGSVSLERDIFPAWIGRGLVACRKRVRFLDIGTPESYGMAERFFSENKR